MDYDLLINSFIFQYPEHKSISTSTVSHLNFKNVIIGNEIQHLNVITFHGIELTFANTSSFIHQDPKTTQKQQ